MRKQDYLVQLINSMTAVERKFFKEYIKKINITGNYLSLFNALEGAKTYNTIELCKLLGKTKAKLAHEKERLQQLLLRGVRLWAESSSAGQTADLLVKAQEVTLLSGRNLFSYAYNTGKRSAESAVHQERYELANILLNSNAECLAIMGDYSEAVHLKEAVINNNSIIMECDELSLLQLKMIKVISRGRVDPAQFEYLPKHPLMIKPAFQLRSYNAKMTQLALWCYYYENVVIDHKKMLHYVEEMYALCLASQEAPYFNPSNMATAMSHLIMLLSLGGKYDGAMVKLEELETWLARHKNGSALYKYERYVEVQRLVLYNELHQFDKTTESAGRMVRWPKEEFLGYNEAILFYHAVALFHSGKTDACLKILQKLIAIESRTREELMVPTRILFIMAQYDTGNRRLLPHLVNSLYAFLKRARRNNPTARSLSELLNRLARSEYHPLYDEDWKILYNKINGVEFGEGVRELFMPLWLKRKCDGTETDINK